MTIDKAERAYQAAEHPMLESWLEYHRATLAMKCDGHADFLRERIDGTVPCSDHVESTDYAEPEGGVRSHSRGVASSWGGLYPPPLPQPRG